MIYAGMGETTIRGNVSRGDGVYKSSDAGRSWQHIGLTGTQNIGSIAIHPSNPDLVYVAAFGHVWGPNAERGLYRSEDGGRSWQNILTRDNQTGALDIAMNPSNPREIYVSFWQARRTPYSLESGGPGSGIFKTVDGGDSWTEITRNRGLPDVETNPLIGKVGLAVAPKQDGRIWAIVEANDAGLYRSDDGGESWQLLSNDANIIQRPWYWMHIFADPVNPNTVWLPGFEFMKSIDGGRTFEVYATPHADNHDLWIDPNDTDRMIMGNDGGATITVNGGRTWSTIYNQTTAEFYHVITDNRKPYRVYGAQQDNTTMSVPSRSNSGAINFTEWEEIGGGESGYIAVRPDNPDIIFAGSYQGVLTRYDHATGLVKNINVWPENGSGWAVKDWKYRFQWTAPTVLSPHNPDVLYHGGNMLFRTTDQGQSWQEASPDLTRGDPETLGPSGGPITKDMTGAEAYGTIFTVAESPVEPGVIWCGSDDGLIYVSRDGGDTWQIANPEGLPDWALISIIEPSPHQRGKAYVAATRYKSHDDRPYLFRTDDYGATWTAIADGIPATEFTRVIREDPDVPGLLFAGTEKGIWVSFNDGANWDPLQLNLPVVPIHDFVVSQGDLVVATHGRSFWILDDLTPLREIARGVSDDTDVLFSPRPTYSWGGGKGFGHGPVEGVNSRMAGGLNVRFNRKTLPDGEVVETMIDAGNNPPDGVMIHYYLTEEPGDELFLVLLDDSGQTIQQFSQDDEDNPLRAVRGANRFVWDMRYPDAATIEDDEVAKTFVRGPKAPPGRYQVQLHVAGEIYDADFEILPDPRVDATIEDFQAQFAFQIDIRDKLSAIHRAVERIRNLREQIESCRKAVAAGDAQSAANELLAQLTEIESKLVQVRAKGPKDRLKYPVMENAKLATLMSNVASAQGRPTKQSYDLYSEIVHRVDNALGQLQKLSDNELLDFNEMVREAGGVRVLHQEVTHDN